jgi:hypothetical protein
MAAKGGVDRLPPLSHAPGRRHTPRTAQKSGELADIAAAQRCNALPTTTAVYLRMVPLRALSRATRPRNRPAHTLGRPAAVGPQCEYVQRETRERHRGTRSPADARCSHIPCFSNRWARRRDDGSSRRKPFCPENGLDSSARYVRPMTATLFGKASADGTHCALGDRSLCNNLVPTRLALARSAAVVGRHFR